MKSLRERVLRLFNYKPVALEHPPELARAGDLPPETASLLNQAMQTHESSTRVTYKTVEKMEQKSESVRATLRIVAQRLER